MLKSLKKIIFLATIVFFFLGCRFDPEEKTKNIVGRFSLNVLSISDEVSLIYEYSENSSMILVENCTLVKYDATNKVIYVMEGDQDHYTRYYAFVLYYPTNPVSKLAYSQRDLNEKEFKSLTGSCINCIDIEKPVFDSP